MSPQKKTSVLTLQLVILSEPTIPAVVNQRLIALMTS